MTAYLEYAALPALAAQRRPDRTALRFEGRAWTYRELDRAVAGVAARLARAGVGAGIRTLLLVENRPEYVFAQFALARLGAVFVVPNPYWTEHEMARVVAAAGAEAAIYAPQHRASAAALPIAIPVEELATAATEGMSVPSPSAEPVPATAELCVPFSSGTTGLPKGVVHTVGSLSGGIGQLVAHLGLTDADRLQISLPLCHIFGTSMMGAALAVGAEVTLFERFDFDRCLRQIREDAVTVWPLAGAVAHRLAHLPQLSRADFPGLRYFMWGGSAVPAELAATITDRTGVGFLCSYGMTEAFAIAFNPVGHPEQWRLDSPGFLSDGIEIRLGAHDEIEVRGPCVAARYTAAPQDDPFLPGGWFRTGDVGRIDADGRLWIVDRLKDMIKVSGFQVAPAEIEAELRRHPAVTDAAVIGRPDPHRGERVVAFVVTAEPVSAEELLAAAAERLATYKLPREIVVVDELPRTAAGKLQRARLRTPEQG
ncbi:class I adenylate-forming enzyme family protein [Rhodococcus sp. B50]|uniref:class I adenylate-forming enzyme family protein n=1 Tax=Rhodococcus sp. B50 TaxID=2682847 RepID=UPI001BD2C58B|nr:class I adenylate-forming enzyme family protein [Rhodococcus sp. B50]MBS9376442.1 Long-chain-fatty-acid--CoA ligase [Rhodococcus sp. B50]